MTQNASEQTVLGSEHTVPESEHTVLDTEPRRRSGMLVGVDGSSGSLHALRWAAYRVDEFGPIQPILAWHIPWWAYSAPLPPATEHFKEAAVKTAEETIASVLPGQCLPPIVSRSQAGPTLVEVGKTARLIVVGTRGRSGLQDAMLGSVSSYVAAKASTPVAVIPASAPLHSPHGRVVVAVDGSVNSVRALTWAFKHSKEDTVIEAVHAWSYPPSSMQDVATIPQDLFEEHAHRTLDEAVTAVSRASGTLGHKIIKKIEYGDPRSVLRDQAEGCDLMVVGARGRGGIGHLVLGSVATAMIHQPTVPTVVIPVAEDW